MAEKDMETIELREGEHVAYTEQDVIAALHAGNEGILDAWYRQQLAEADRSLETRLGLEQKKAELLYMAGRDADAVDTLRRAVALAHGAGDSETKVMLEKRLLQMQGKPVPTLQELSPVEQKRRVLRTRNAIVQQELISLQKHDSAEAAQLGPERTAARVAKLKAELQDLIDREASLR